MKKKAHLSFSFPFPFLPRSTLGHPSRALSEGGGVTYGKISNYGPANYRQEDDFLQKPFFFPVDNQWW